MVMVLQTIEGKNKAVGGKRINQRGKQFKTLRQVRTKCISYRYFITTFQIKRVI